MIGYELIGQESREFEVKRDLHGEQG